MRWIKRCCKNPKQIQEAEASLGYIGRSCLRNNNKIKMINLKQVEMAGENTERCREGRSARRRYVETQQDWTLVADPREALLPLCPAVLRSKSPYFLLGLSV